MSIGDHLLLKNLVATSRPNPNRLWGQHAE
jgi:hypothetical protein